MKFLFAANAILLLTVHPVRSQNVWERVAGHPTEQFSRATLTHIAVDPQNVLWAFTQGDAAYRSEDGGASFTEFLDVQFRRAPGTIYSTHFTPESAMYVGSMSNSISTLDRGGWLTYAPSPSDWILDVHVTESGKLLAGTGSGIFQLGPVQVGHGYTWPKLLSSSQVHDILEPSGGVLLAATEDGIYRSPDDGVTWSLVHTPTRPQIYALGETSDGQLLASGVITCPFFSGTGQYEGGVYRSVDGGATWTVSSTGLTTPGGACIVPIRDLIVTPDDEAVIAMEYAVGFGMTAGVFLSTDKGDSWSSYNTGLQQGDLPWQFTISPGGQVYLYSNGPGANGRAIYARTGSATSAETGEMPVGIVLEQNYPNPFNPSTTITFSLDAPQHVRVAVYDQLGREVAQLANGMMSPGRHEVSFDAGTLPSGSYHCRLEAERTSLSRTLTLIR